MSGSGVVVFDYAAWAARYPELASSVGAPAAQLFFNDAGLYLANTPQSAIQDLTIRTSILYMITSHIAALEAPLGGQASSPIVGRINSATEGSVSVTAELLAPASAAWWAQTKYGFAAWQAMAPYRVGIYVPPPQIPLAQQSYPFFGFGGAWRR